MLKPGLVAVVLGFICIANAAFAGDSQKPKAFTEKLSGSYVHRQKSYFMNGATYTAEDDLVIIPLAENAAYFNTTMAFANGHTCSAGGLAEFAAPDTLVYNPADDEKCILTITLKNQSIIFSDEDSCKDFCGMRGAWDASYSFSIKHKHKLSAAELTKLQKSEEYVDSLNTYYKIHPELKPITK